MPYARLVQERNLVTQKVELDSRTEWTRAAFIGWQVTSALGGKTGPFKKYLKTLGLDAPKQRLSRDQIEKEKAAAFAAADLVEARFDRKDTQ